MNTTEKRIGFACALGAFVGALISLELAKFFVWGKYLWTVGAFVGGLVGYVSYQFKEIVSACREQEKRQRLFEAMCDIWSNLLKPTIKTVSEICAGFFVVILAQSLGIMAVLSITTPLSFTGQESLVDVIATFCLISLVPTILTFPMYCKYHEEKISQLGEWRVIYNYLLHFNLFGVMWHTLCGTFWLLTKIPKIVRECLHFARGVFITVHSDIRTICFVDSVLGATAGYFAGSALVGAVIGGLSGVLNYRLVSIRWLKLSPKT